MEDTKYSDTSESSSSSSSDKEENKEKDFPQQIPIMEFGAKPSANYQYLVIPWPIVFIILGAFGKSLTEKKYEGKLIDITENINSYNEAMMLIHDIYDRLYSSINKWGIKLDDYKPTMIKLKNYLYSEDEADNAIKLLAQKFVHSKEILKKYMKINPSL